MADVDTVRLLIADLAEDESTRAFTDTQLQGFLDLEGTVRSAAALALETIATSEVLTSKVIRTLDLATDGAKVAAELRARAAALREQDANSADSALILIPGYTRPRWA